MEDKSEINYYQQYQSKKSFDCDLYIMIPCEMEDDVESAPKIQEAERDKVADKWLYEVNDYLHTFISGEIVDHIRSYFLGRKRLAYLSINYDEKAEGQEDAYLFLLQHGQADLYLLVIAVFLPKNSVTRLVEQSASDSLFFTEGGTAVSPKDNVTRYIRDTWHLAKVGENKHLVTMSNMPDDRNEFLSMLACETYKDFLYDEQMRDYYRLSSDDIEKEAEENFSQYNFYGLYASRRNVIFIPESYSKCDTPANIEDDVTILFIIIPILFKSTAILRTNAKITAELAVHGDATMRTIDNLYTEFGKTVVFWEDDVYRDITTSNIAKHINQAFRTDQIMESYLFKQNFLTQIVKLHDVQSSNREGKVLNTVVIILTIIQVLPVLTDFWAWLGKNEYIFGKAGLAGGGTAALLIIILIAYRHYRRNNP